MHGRPENSSAGPVLLCVVPLTGFVIKSIEQMCQKHPAKVLELAGMELRDWRPILDV